MASGRGGSVNTGRASSADWAGRLKRTAIDKRPVAGPVPVGRLGVAGDEQVDKENHGGDEQALYVYAREDLDWWVEQLGRELPDGTFGENITTAGLDISGALISETWRLGTALVQVTAPRVPCATFAGWLDEKHWVKRFADAGRPGAYLRVLDEGVVGGGDPVEDLDPRPARPRPVRPRPVRTRPVRTRPVRTRPVRTRPVCGRRLIRRAHPALRPGELTCLARCRTASPFRLTGDCPPARWRIWASSRSAGMYMCRSVRPAAATATSTPTPPPNSVPGRPGTPTPAWRSRRSGWPAACSVLPACR